MKFHTELINKSNLGVIVYDISYTKATNKGYWDESVLFFIQNV